MSEPLPSQAESPVSAQTAIAAQSFDLTSLAPAERHFWTRGFADRLTIDGLGVRVEYARSRPQAFRWDDTKLEFFLVDWRAPAARNDRWATPSQAKRTPFQFFPGPFSRPTSASMVWITEPAYQALYHAGFARRLHACNGGGRSYARDAIVTIFSRKPPGRWVRELNPNAEG
jgi:hypothetical protein